MTSPRAGWPAPGQARVLALACALACASALAGCGDGTGDAQQARQAAGMNVIARQVVDLPGVTCVQAGPDSQGLPQAPRGSVRATLTFDEGLTRQQQEQLVLETGRRVWRSDLSVLQLTVSGPAGVVQLDDLLGAPGNATPADLEQAYGPRPPLPSPLPDIVDPGGPVC